MIIEGKTGSWEIVIGLEVHAQVVSNAKLFSGAATAFGAEPNAALSDFDEAAFAYLPAARVSFSYSPRGPLAVVVRLGSLSPDETLDPAVLDRVYRGLQQVRPAGVRVLLAINDEIVRGR